MSLRPDQVLTFVGIALYVAVAAGQQSSPNVVLAETNSDTQNSNGSQPEIPLDVLSYNLMPPRRVPLTDAQVEAFGKTFQEVRRLASNSVYVNAAVEAINLRGELRPAAGLIEQQNEDFHTGRLLQMLTNEQRELFHQKYKAEIQQSLARRKNISTFVSPTSELSCMLLKRGDLLGVCMNEDMRTKLQLTAGQSTQLNALQQELRLDLLIAIEECTAIIPDVRRSRASEPEPDLALLHQKTVNVLNPEQRKKYESHVRSGQEHALLLASNRTFHSQEEIRKSSQEIRDVMKKNREERHGRIIESSVRVENGKVTQNLSLFNYFDSEEISVEYGLTEDQKTKISDILEQTRSAIAEKRRKQRQTHQNFLQLVQETVEGKIQCVQFAMAQRVKDVLTESQILTIERHKYVRANLKTVLSLPELSRELSITEEQVSAIQEVLSRESPMAARWRKITEAKGIQEHRRASRELSDYRDEDSERQREFERQQASDLDVIATPEQKAKFTELTGLIWQHAL
jgi:hypothetical protein